MRRFTTSIVTAAVIGLATTGVAWSWGAICVDDSFGDEPSGVGYGFATEASTRQEASIGAMDACKAEGNDECKVVLVFKACGAYASSRTNFGTGTGATLETAEKRAKDSCAGPDCVVVVSGCE